MYNKIGMYIVWAFKVFKVNDGKATNKNILLHFCN